MTQEPTPETTSIIRFTRREKPAPTLLAPDAAPYPAPSAYAARGAPDLPQLTLRRISEIMEQQHDDADFLLGNGYLTRGDRTAISGMGGVGKSRLVTQLALCCRTGRDFIGWETRCPDKRWLFLQTENSPRRLKDELDLMLSAFTDEERAHIDAGLFFHTLEGTDDGYVALGDLDNRHRIADAIARAQADVVVFDPLRDFASADLNSDHGMSDTLRILQRLTATGDAKRVPLIIHHAGTGRAGIQKVMGYDRSSFIRNSKAIHGWARAVINVAPIKPDDNGTLVIASGKCNNATEFKPFCVRLNDATMFYEVDEDVDLEAWQEKVNGEGGGKFRPSKGRTQSAVDLLKMVEPNEVVAKEELEARARSRGMTARNFPVFFKQLEEQGELVVTLQRRPPLRPRVMVSRPSLGGGEEEGEDGGPSEEAQELEFGDLE